MLEVSLEVEDGNNRALLEPQQLGKRRIRVNGLAVKQGVCLTVVHNTLGDIRAGDQRLLGELEESKQLRGNLAGHIEVAGL